MFRRLTTILLAATIALAALAPVALAGPSEGNLLSKINAERSARGLPSLSSHGTLTAHARSHSAAMAASDSTYHSSSATLKGLVSGWSKIGENVGRGPNAAALHAAFMGSSGHKANILGDYTHAGVGTAVDDAGILYVTVVFMKLAGAAPTTTTTTTAPPTTTTTAAPTTTAPAAQPATAPTTTAPPRSVSVTPAPPTTTTTTVPAPPSVDVDWDRLERLLPNMGIPQVMPCTT